MPDDLGGNTEDLRTLGRPDPAEQTISEDDRETHIRATARRHKHLGYALITFAYGGSLIVMNIGTYMARFNLRALIFGVICLSVVTNLGLILIADARAEKRERYARAATRELIRVVRGNADSMKTIRDILAPIPTRLDAVEQGLRDVPDYGRGVIDGVQMRAAALSPERD